MEKVLVIRGKYQGKIGKATFPNEAGNIIFYPQDKVPYRVCLCQKDIKKISWQKQKSMI